MLPLLLALACTPTEAEPDDGPPPYAVPDGATTARYAPFDAFDTFPDAVHQVPDDRLPTGWRVQITEGAKADLGSELPDAFTLFPALEDLDGFGLTAAITLRFSGPVDPASLDDALTLWDLRDQTSLPYELEPTADLASFAIQPLLPLRPDAPYAVTVDATLTDDAGEPVYPSADLWAFVHGEGPPHVTDLWSQALALADLVPDALVHGTVFHTMSLHDQDRAFLALLDEHPPKLIPDGPCEVSGDVRRCDAILRATEVFDDDGRLALHGPVTARGTLDIPTRIWLPAEGDGPFPVALHGHGLGGTLREGDGHARRLAPMGWAVAATDAPRHGNHPTAQADTGLVPILDFFGISLTDLSFSVPHLRDNFRRAAWERVQLAAALRQPLDLNGDGEPDLDPSEIHLSGHSLGALLGVATLGLDPDLQSGHLSVPGGRVSTIIHRGGQFAPLIALMSPPDAAEDDIDRFFPILQTAIDPAEPMLWAAEAASRDLLVTLVVDDFIIPNACTLALARALDVPVVGERLVDDPLLRQHPDPFPVQGNGPDGRTHGLYHFDEMLRDGDLVPATHIHIWRSQTENQLVEAWYPSLLEGASPSLVAPP